MKFKINKQIESIKPYEPGRPLREVAKQYQLTREVRNYS